MKEFCRFWLTAVFALTCLAMFIYLGSVAVVMFKSYPLQIGTLLTTIVVGFTLFSIYYLLD